MAVSTRTALLHFVFMSVLVEYAVAVTYTVGHPIGGWDSSTDLKLWSKSQTFYVGDNINFKYSPDHNVLEVTKEDYDSCETRNSLEAYSGGSTTIPLSFIGRRYFICGVVGHCSDGMKIEVVTSYNPEKTSSGTPLASSLSPNTSNVSPSPSPAPAPALSPLLATKVFTSISKTACTPKSSAASSFEKGRVTLGFGTTMMLFFAF